ncbi:uncharacterized protein LOC126317237 [Schistocerca gregaria]|uniref:uncharacterized protein LOC126317237 n=1 Tax=Schistocerca gregaria TaxID=7010 RepID=UPI00211E34B8|nr:uncharacterized protein LOC126317237 [Schistocerca gregaria]
MHPAGPQPRPRLLGPLLAASAVLLLVLYYCHSSAWRDPALQVEEVAGTEAEAGALEEPPEVTTAAGWPNSTCGEGATARGPGQRVVAFSYYGDVNNTRGYYTGIERNAAAIGGLYPGWTMRVYHDVPPGDRFAASRELDRLSREFPHLDLCYVGDVPGYGDLRGRQQNAWRFLAMADPLVDVFISRDLDALPLEREVGAVREWLESNATFHVMRDHTGHNVPILAGMWGARPELKREALKALAEVITGEPKGKKGQDQWLLAKHVWPNIRGDVWQHDAFYCHKYSSHGHMRAFPTPRNHTVVYNFVGNRFGVDTQPLVKECPQQCRPADHQDWLYC